MTCFSPGRSGYVARVSERRGVATPLCLDAMERPARFEETRFLGDKRAQVVYDLDDVDDESIIEELASGSYAQTFGPDTLAEARNRCYRLRKI